MATTWKRWTELTKTFPSNKYNFKKYLTRPGDYVWTNPMTKEDASRIKKAAENWAYYKKYRVSVYRYPEKDGMQSVKIKLLSLTRIREYS